MQQETSAAQSFANFDEFYPFYVGQHANRICRRMHFIGTSSALAGLAMLIASGNPWWIAYMLVSGYACAWIGHFVFEGNKPASFGHPLYSFRGDWLMYWQMWTGKLTW